MNRPMAGAAVVCLIVIPGLIVGAWVLAAARHHKEQ